MPASETKYVELLSQQDVPALPTPFGAGYPVLFDETIDTHGYSEIRVWVHVFVRDYAAHPVTSNTKLALRFMHTFFGSNSFDYEEAQLPWKGVTSYINGYTVKPLLGDKLRLLCHPDNLPTGPYDIYVTYCLVR
jgi:hypothetical protein